MSLKIRILACFGLEDRVSISESQWHSVGCQDPWQASRSRSALSPGAKQGHTVLPAYTGGAQPATMALDGQIPPVPTERSSGPGYTGVRRCLPPSVWAHSAWTCAALPPSLGQGKDLCGSWSLCGGAELHPLGILCPGPLLLLVPATLCHCIPFRRAESLGNALFPN